MTINTGKEEALKREISGLKSRVSVLEKQLKTAAFNWVIKETTGTPAVGYEGIFYRNNFDDTVHIYTDGAFKQIYP